MAEDFFIIKVSFSHKYYGVYSYDYTCHQLNHINNCISIPSSTKCLIDTDIFYDTWYIFYTYSARQILPSYLRRCERNEPGDNSRGIRSPRWWKLGITWCISYHFISSTSRVQNRHRQIYKHTRPKLDQVIKHVRTEHSKTGEVIL